jgi:hypothetical protein
MLLANRDFQLHDDAKKTRTMKLELSQSTHWRLRFFAPVRGVKQLPYVAQPLTGLALYIARESWFHDDNAS